MVVTSFDVGMSYVEAVRKNELLLQKSSTQFTEDTELRLYDVISVLMYVNG